ncbi:uncharacterized protein N7496_009504 [Penicillium cataractarum]|uniref:Uncharacterized protein n=1 Tax=Penicillium cataractarum TaxID=2100454 RepID=A0A9W9V2H9_9EURO|nr:uncharacterized protein N7496_009504 [Penicillium cataractarum]KAJ5363791.1 hypothetical protein N7496_009504 [Penicillium cataractarum]
MKSEHIPELRHLLTCRHYTIGSASGDQGPIYDRGRIPGASGHDLTSVNAACLGHDLLLGHTVYDTSRVILRPDETLVEDSVARVILWMRYAPTRRPSRYRPSRRRGLVLAAGFLPSVGHMVIQTGEGIQGPGTDEIDGK